MAQTCPDCGKEHSTARRMHSKTGRCPKCYNAELERWRQNDPKGILYRQGYHQVERARKAKAVCVKHPARCKVIDRDLVFIMYGGRCGICRRLIRQKKWHLDHTHPLSRGGKHCYSNVKPAHSRCNLRKGSRVRKEDNANQRRG